MTTTPDQTRKTRAETGPRTTALDWACSVPGVDRPDRREIRDTADIVALTAAVLHLADALNAFTARLAPAPARPDADA